MKVGIIVDGQAEFQSLRHILPGISTTVRVAGPLKANIQPKANSLKIVKAVAPSIAFLLKKSVTRVIVLVDMEDRAECIPSWVSALESEFLRCCVHLPQDGIWIILKDRMYESWLVGALEAIQMLSARFDFSRVPVTRIQNSGSDGIDALKILKTAARKEDYNKVVDAQSIMQKADPYQIAQHSRSFRRFLRLIGCRQYAGQSRIAVPRR